MLKKRLSTVLAVVGISVMALTGCAGSNTDITDPKLSQGDDKVTIEQLSADETNSLVEEMGTSFEEFSPILEDNKITFITGGSSSCTPTPIAAKAEQDATKVAFKVYDENEPCTADFGIYGWSITFTEPTPAAGMPFFKCENGLCYSNTGETVEW